jgi:hypothetical protein
MFPKPYFAEALYSIIVFVMKNTESPEKDKRIKTK